MASTGFNAYPHSGTKWHDHKIIYGYVTEDAGSSVSWWIGLDRQTFAERAKEADARRRVRRAAPIESLDTWVMVGDVCD